MNWRPIILQCLLCPGNWLISSLRLQRGPVFFKTFGVSCLACSLTHSVSRNPCGCLLRGGEGNDIYRVLELPTRHQIVITCGYSQAFRLSLRIERVTEDE